tara:strand:- start:66 stop:977 length:912 start_codon:yes stop_codon:yes gene_type:complete
MSKIKYFYKRFFLYLSKGDFKSIFYKSFFTLFGNNKIDLDKLTFQNNLSLDELFLRFGSDKGKYDGKKTYDHLILDRDVKFKNYEEWIKRENAYNFEHQLGHDFTSIYEKIFENLKDKNINFLEIGVANGHSIASWYKYFSNASINGMDIKKKDKLFYKGDRLNYSSVDCLNQKQVNNFLKKNKKFDVIIDDSSHTYDAFFFNIKNFYKHLNDGGIYILEDFRGADRERKLSQKFNKENSGIFLQRDKYTIEQIFDYILKKEKFNHSILTSNDLDFIFDNTEKSSIIKTEHPNGALAILFRKN